MALILSKLSQIETKFQVMVFVHKWNHGGEILPFLKSSAVRRSFSSILCSKQACSLLQAPL